MTTKTTYTHKDGSTIIGLPDGGVCFSFIYWPTHNRNGRIEVSFSAKTIKRMKRIGQAALEQEV